MLSIEFIWINCWNYVYRIYFQLRHVKLRSHDDSVVEGVFMENQRNLNNGSIFKWSTKRKLWARDWPQLHNRRLSEESWLPSATRPVQVRAKEKGPKLLNLPIQTLQISNQFKCNTYLKLVKIWQVLVEFIFLLSQTVVIHLKMVRVKYK